MNKKINTRLMIAMLLFSNFAFSSSSMLVYAELGGYDTKTNQVIINGKSYDLKIDVNKSEYSEDYMKTKLVQKYQLKAGMKYYFNLFTESNDDDADFDQVVFISEEKPES